MKFLEKIVKSLKSHKALWISGACVLLVLLGLGTAALAGAFGGGQQNAPAPEVDRIEAVWPMAFELEEYQEPPFTDDASRTNNAFNVKDFGEQGKNGWFYRYGDAKKPLRSRQIERFDGETYSQMGANGLERRAAEAGERPHQHHRGASHRDADRRAGGGEGREPLLRGLRPEQQRL